MTFHSSLTRNALLDSAYCLHVLTHSANSDLNWDLKNANGLAINKIIMNVSFGKTK